MAKIKTEVEIPIGPYEIAEIFINMDDHDQALVLNKIGKLFKKADFNAEMQCCAISDKITKSGKDFLYTMANFVKVQKFKGHEPHFGMLINTYLGDSLDSK
jgi:hypothetical protein